MKRYFFLLVFFVLAPVASAYEIKNVSTEIRNDFVLSPAKVDVRLDPGGSAVEYLTVTNRNEEERSFGIEIEDFKGSQDMKQAIFLLGNEKGPYSLKDFLMPEVTEFSLKSNQSITFSVLIRTPANVSPGGLYGSVLISSAPKSGGGGTVTVSRIGTLFFVRVNGDVVEDGKLANFSLKNPKQYFYQKGPFTFNILYKNFGSVHLAPYGIIRVTNIFGQVVDEIPIEPYFAMPDSVRYLEIGWDKGSMLGKYTATISLNRGYKNMVDTAEVSFIVLPYRVIGWTFAGVFVLLLIARFIGSRFEIKMKKK